MTRKPTGLSAAMARKAAQSAPPPAATEPKGDTIRTLTLRLSEIAHNQLRELAFAERRSQHSLLMEALNDLFTKRGKPPIAPGAT